MFPRFFAASLVAGLAFPTAAQQGLPASYEDCRRAEDPQAGIAACREALQSSLLLESERARAFLTLARYQRLSGDLQAALASLNKAAAIAPNAPDIPAERALVLQAGGDLAGAMAAHARASDMGAATPAMLNNRGVTRLASGDPAGAIRDFDAALDLLTDGTVLDNRATARCAAGDTDGSVTDRLAAIANDGVAASQIESAMKSSGFAGTIDADAGTEDNDALARWTAAGCPGAEPARFF